METGRDLKECDWQTDCVSTAAAVDSPVKELIVTNDRWIRCYFCFIFIDFFSSLLSCLNNWGGSLLGGYLIGAAQPKHDQLA